MVWIALCGPMGSGKTTSAKYLEKKYGFLRFSLATPLKQLAREWFEMKQKNRKLLQELGDKLLEIDQEVFCRYLISRILELPGKPSYYNIVVDDLRYKVEERFLRSFGFKIILIDRPKHLRHADGMAEQTTQHRSEREWPEIQPDRIINNNSSLAKLYFELDVLMMDFKKEPLDLEEDWYLATGGRAEFEAPPKRGRGRPRKRTLKLTEEERDRLIQSTMKHGLYHVGPMLCRYCPHNQKCAFRNKEDKTQECVFEKQLFEKGFSVAQMKEQMVEALGEVILRLLTRVKISARYGTITVINATKVADLGVKYLSMLARIKEKERRETRLFEKLVKKDD